MTISRVIAEALQQSSWIRKMFETGRELKARLGEDKVFDFSLGNPLLEPPREVVEALQRLTHAPPPGLHRYTPNNGLPGPRAAVAAHVTEQHGAAVTADDVVMTVGAAGALNVALRSILDRGNQVIIPAPYFVEHVFYVRLHGGTPSIVETTEDFDLDIEAIDRAIGPRTKALIINTPHNPTGRIYCQQRMTELATVLQRHEQQLGRPIYLIADTPYARLTFDGLRNPQLMVDHPNTVLAHSHSKDLGLAGERIGYLVVSPHAADREPLRAAFSFCNRVLGFVNAPVLMQRVVEHAIDASVDVGTYQSLRDTLCQGLAEAGYQFVAPQGGFYVFPSSPIADDVAFTNLLQQQNVLVVPGSGFGRGGHVRIAFCVREETVRGALPIFAAVMRQLKG